MERPIEGQRAIDLDQINSLIDDSIAACGDVGKGHPERQMVEKVVALRFAKLKAIINVQHLMNNGLSLEEGMALLKDECDLLDQEHFGEGGSKNGH